MQCTTSKAGKRAKAGRKGRNTPKEKEQEPTTCTRWTPPPPPQKRMKAAPRKPQTQNIFHFCRFWSPKFPRKHQSTPKKNSLLPLFALIRCPFDLVSAGGVRKQKRMKACLIYSEHTKRDTPPIGGAASALYPHNFSHQKYSKKSAQRTG